jgi:hydroxymethylglutaryl-CoA lyase
VRIVEVSPRDGLQNESKFVPTEDKIEFISLLAETGLPSIEATSFVSPIWIPQMSDNQNIMQCINKELVPRFPEVDFVVLTPNMKGLKNAINAGAKIVAVFGAATEAFSKANINKTIDASFEAFAEMCDLASQKNIRVRGYLSCALGCPYEGDVDPKKVAILAKKLWDLGCYEISLGDTIGIGTPGKWTVSLGYNNAT